MLLSNNLNIDILVIIFVKRSSGKRVANPEVDGVGTLLESYACPGDIFLYMGEERGVFVPKVVVF